MLSEICKNFQAQITKISGLVIGCLTTKLPAPTTKLGEGATVCFCKIFYQVFKSETYYNTYKEFYDKHFYV